MPKRFAVPAILVLVAALAPAAAQAAPPPNDAFGEPAALSVDDEISAVNLEASGQTDEPEPGSVAAEECANADDAPLCASSVWYAFEAPETTDYTIETCDGGTDLDTVLGVYTGASIGALATIGTNDDACAGGFGGNGSRVHFAATEGTTYLIDVTGYHADRGSFYLRAYEGLPQTYIGADTAIDRQNSFAGRRLDEFGDHPGVLSGPRHSASFSLLETIPGSTFECSLDGAAYSACTSPVSLDDLPPGSSHQFAARATAEGFTDPTPVIERFTIDTTPPETSFSSQPPAEVPAGILDWELETSEPHLRENGFACAADSWIRIGCSDGFELDDLCKGQHEFRAAAWDLAGNIDPTPATSTTTVTSGDACAPPTLSAPVQSSPPGPTSSGEITFDYDDGGAGGVLAMEYGTSTSYGSNAHRQTAGPSATGANDYFNVGGLEPGTTYHYRITLTTPFGTAGTLDETFTTASFAPGQNPPTIANGTARVVGLHAAEVPVTIDNGGLDTAYSLRLVFEGPVEDEYVTIAGDDEFIPASLTGSQQRSIEVVDLDPGTYHYRFAAFQQGPLAADTIGPEGTFAVPAAEPPVPLGPTATRFKLKRKNVKAGKLRRRSKKLLVKVSGLPAKTKVRLQIKVGKRKQNATKKANAKGRAKLKVTLSKRIRKALADRKVRKAILKVTATPPGQRASSVVIKQKLKP
jgi:hypothetical protein